MFDQVTNLVRPFYETGDLRDLNVNVQVTEQKAPTDDSIKFALEMEQRVREKLEQGVQLDLNGLKVFYYKDQNHFEMSEIHRFVFDLNGKRETIDVEIQEFLFAQGQHPQNKAKEIVKQFSEKFARLILDNMKEKDFQMMFERQ